MLVEEKKVSIQASNMKDTVDFRAKLDGMMFDNLINGIYSNKIGAGIREYSTNARDGHARRGNLSRPFEIGLPTRDKAFFEVRDFGSSLTHQEVFDIYAVLGESTKRDTNDETGCLGLGSKSAFAYTNAFSVTCWKNGEKRDYSCYIGEAGQPKVSLISTIKSNEEEGVRVSYAVKQSDIEAFNKEASLQLRGFDPQPKVIRKTESYKPLDETDLVLKGDGWKLYKAESTGYYHRNVGKPMAVQGSVAYPIDVTNGSLSVAISNVREKDVTPDRVRKLLSDTNILMRFNIGDIRVTTSREELAYDDNTCKNIVNKCVEVLRNIQKTLDEEYKNCPTMKDARILRAKTLDAAQDIERILGIKDRFWQGEVIHPFVVVAEIDGCIGKTKGNEWYTPWYAKKDENKLESKTVTGTVRVITDSNYKNKFGEIKAQFPYPEKSNKNTEYYKRIKANKVSDMKILIEIPSLISKNKNNLMRDYWKNKLSSSDNEFLWVVANSTVDASLFLQDIYHDEPENVTYLHKCDELKMPSKGTKASLSANSANPLERKFRYIRGQRYYYVSQSADFEVVDLSTATDKLPVIFFQNGIVFDTHKDMVNNENGQSLKNMVEFLGSWGWDQKTYIINGQQEKFYKDNKSKFVNAMDLVKDHWIKKNPTWEEEYAKSQYKDDDWENSTAKHSFEVLYSKYNISFKTIQPCLARDRKDNNAKVKPSRFLYSNYKLPFGHDKMLKAEKEAAIKKYPQTKKGQEYKDMLAKDPTLKFLIESVSEYSTSNETLEAIKHYKTLINE